jgi:hypothetical protein
MKYLRIALGIVAVALVALVMVPDAQAQATRTWVSGVGDDVNPCSRTAPCKTFAGAISKTAAHGEISVLDPGGFGAVTIGKSMTINGDGTLAGILAAGVNGIIVNLPATTDKVNIRSITINGANTGLNGIRHIGVGTLNVQNVAIYGFNSSGSSRGMDITTLAGGGDTILNDVTINDCANGIRFAGAGGHTATFTDVRIQDNVSHAVDSAAGNNFILIRRGAISNNGGDGVRASVATTNYMVEDSSLSFNNGTGVNAAVAGSKIRIANNNINVNGVGINAVGTIESTGNNRVAGNSSTAPGPFGTYVQQ